MNPQFRKIALITASLGLLLSLFLALRPQDEPVTPTTNSTPTTTAAEPTVPAATEPPPGTTATEQKPRPKTMRILVEDGQPVGGIERATVDQGAGVVLVVVADVSDRVHVHGYDLFVDVVPGSPARLAFEATVAGRFEVEFEGRHVHLADLEVRP
ncbi:MAG: hypothetical protein H0V94_03650 [Actinobacteria bacterium]|nr:hypothetical protein [Actinomycetota bacterium]